VPSWIREPRVLICDCDLERDELSAELLLWLSNPGAAVSGLAQAPGVLRSRFRGVVTLLLCPVPAGFGCGQKARREADHRPDHTSSLVTVCCSGIPLPSA